LPTDEMTQKYRAVRAHPFRRPVLSKSIERIMPQLDPFGKLKEIGEEKRVGLNCGDFICRRIRFPMNYRAVQADPFCPPARATAWTP